jgi:hypothetical protein
VPSAAAAITAAATARPAATSAASTLGLRAGFVNYQIPTTEILAIERIDGAVGVFIIVYFHECKSARLSREAVANKIYCRGSDASLGKPFVQLLLRRGKRKVPDIELLHRRTPSFRNPLAVAERTEGTAGEFGQS